MNIQEASLFKKLEEISKVLEKEYPGTEDVGVLSGISGMALFAFYYSRFTGKERYADLGSEILSLVFERINNGYTMHTFCAGIPGALWSMELLREEGFIDIDHDTLLRDFDDFLSGSIKRYKDINFYDFLHGVLGIGYYFLKRYRNTGSETLKKRYREELSGIIKLLGDRAEREGETCKWESFLIRDEGLKGYNLSLSHGMSGIVSFLSRLLVHPDFYTEVRPVLEGAVGYIVQWENTAAGSSVFPGWITSAGEKSEKVRLGWCYGDLGTALSLWHAGSALKDDVLCEKAVQVLKHTTKRRDTEEAGVKDAGLCHGIFGIMHIYRYMYRQTGEKEFAEAARFWQEKGLSADIHEKGYAGYMQWRGGDISGWRAEANLLEGVAGIGLAIMAELSPDYTKWNECLLIG
ncbi:lanthionine synthetase C family protein [Sinomicrobium kalidii]|uniref:lanthionine synthetase C family protein n=1 Tax=Sinomicrobium kalidii TaxID=2900738 RepID=UPI001E3DD607|nr:lanthionine synthetase C family protein [Sinomicrobium kalidii]UGU15812.1 lanthionine synthetase C family protein [Sinomicrobium kalidii]